MLATGATGPEQASLMAITARPDAVMVRGEGSWLWDADGRRYLDFVQGWAVNALGHAPSVIREALAAQAALLLTPSPAFHNAPQLALARELTSRCAPRPCVLLQQRCGGERRCYQAREEVGQRASIRGL